MGILRQGIFGGFENRTGALVGKRIGGNSVICAVQHKATKPRSQKQLEQGLKFRLVIGFLRRLNSLIALGFKKCAGKGHAFNAAVKYNFNGIITGVLPNYSIDCKGLVFSRGSLAPADTPLLSRGLNSVLVSWQPTLQTQFCRNSDKVLVFIYCPGADVMLTRFSSTARAELEYEVVFDIDLGTLPLDVFMAFVSADGKEVSTSEYLGII
jgi:hypothetical protein